jgi:hypothetical protein
MKTRIKKLELNQETLKNLTDEQNNRTLKPEGRSGGTWCQLCTQGYQQN